MSARLAPQTQTLTADGDTTEFDWPGGTGSMSGQGTFSSGTLTLRFSLDGGTTYNDVTDGTDTASLTASGVVGFEVNFPCKMKLTLAGATTPDIDTAVALGIHAQHSAS